MFMGTDLDTLVIGNCFLKNDQDPSLKKDYKIHSIRLIIEKNIFLNLIVFLV